MRISDWSSDVCSSDLFGPEIFGEDVGHALVCAEIARPFGSAHGRRFQLQREGLLTLSQFGIDRLNTAFMRDDLHRRARRQRAVFTHSGINQRALDRKSVV